MSIPRSNYSHENYAAFLVAWTRVSAEVMSASACPPNLPIDDRNPTADDAMRLAAATSGATSRTYFLAARTAYVDEYRDVDLTGVDPATVLLGGPKAGDPRFDEETS